MRETPNQFHYYQINIQFTYIYLTAKKKFLLFFFALTYTLLVSHKGDNILLSPPWLSSQGDNPLLSLPYISPLRRQAENPFFSLDFMLYFPSPHREDPWAKAIKFFVIWSIYKASFPIPS